MAEPTIRLRPATDDDHAAFLRLHPELGIDDPPPSPAEWTARLVPRTLVVDSGGATLGFIVFETLAGEGYVRNLMVDRSWRRHGAGRLMMLAAAGKLRRAGCKAWRLNVKEDNASAIRLYESLGLRRVHASLAMTLPWAATERLPAPPAPVRARPIEPADDAALEEAFDLPAGQLAGMRQMPGQILVRLDAAEGAEGPPLGLARLDPRFPGAYPFRLRVPSFARAMFDALRPHALPEHPFVKLLIEGDDALVERLAAVGAVTTLRIAHMRGPLPGL
jgi:GNAT superfamily N-acetyltransferase